MQLHEMTFFMGIPVALIWLPIVIGVAIGWIIPLTPIVRRRLHFSPLHESYLNAERDADALKDMLPRLSQGDRKIFSSLLRKLGLTLYVEK